MAGTSIGEVVDKALDAHERAEFWRQTREALARHPEALDADPAWELVMAAVTRTFRLFLDA